MRAFGVHPARVRFLRNATARGHRRRRLDGLRRVRALAVAQHQGPLRYGSLSAAIVASRHPLPVLAIGGTRDRPGRARHRQCRRVLRHPGRRIGIRARAALAARARKRPRLRHRGLGRDLRRLVLPDLLRLLRRRARCVSGHPLDRGDRRSPRALPSRSPSSSRRCALAWARALLVPAAPAARERPRRGDGDAAEEPTAGFDHGESGVRAGLRARRLARRSTASSCQSIDTHIAPNGQTAAGRGPTTLRPRSATTRAQELRSTRRNSTFSCGRAYQSAPY